jgi:hypothetical protein
MQKDYAPYEIRLAREIAEALNDVSSLPYHLQMVLKYKEEFLRDNLMKALTVAEDQIKKSRAALYVYLINQGSRYGDSRN